MLATLAAVLLASAVRAGDTADSESRPLPPRRSAPAVQKDSRSLSAAQAKKSNGGSNGGWWTTAGGLVAVLALIFLVAKVVQKSVPAARKSLPSEVVQVLGRRPLDYRHTIHLVRFGSRLLMLGTSQEGVTTLSEITDQVEIDYLAGLCQPSEPASVSQTFQQLFRRFQNPEPASNDHEAHREEEPELAAGPAVLRLQQRLQKPVPIDVDGHEAASPEAVG
jgi:flagellar biogenesis protein FliO